MSTTTERDWTKLGTVEGMASWLCTKSDAICVLVIRPGDSALIVDQRCKPIDAGELVYEYLPQMIQRLDMERKQGNKVRLELGHCRE